MQSTLLQKKIEVWFRKQFNTLFLSNRAPIVINDPSSIIPKENSPRILFLRQDRIGDVLISTPLLREIRRTFPSAHIGMVLSTNNTAIRDAVHPPVNVIHVYRRSVSSLFQLIKGIRAENYGVVVDLLDNPSTTSSLIISQSNIPLAFGIDKENRGIYTHVVPLKSRSIFPIEERIAELLKLFNVYPQSVDLRPVFSLPRKLVEDARQRLELDFSRPRLGVVLSGSMESKRLGPERTAAIIRLLNERFPAVQVVVFGTPSEAEDIRCVAASCQATMCPPSDSFTGHAAMLQQMTMLWMPDTASVHLAAAWNIPCCVMYFKDVEGRLPWYPHNTHCESVVSETASLKDLTDGSIIDGIERLFAYCEITPTERL